LSVDGGDYLEVAAAVIEERERAVGGKAVAAGEKKKSSPDRLVEDRCGTTSDAGNCGGSAVSSKDVSALSPWSCESGRH
jgi:hypothetical protein